MPRRVWLLQTSERLLKILCLRFWRTPARILHWRINVQVCLDDWDWYEKVLAHFMHLMYAEINVMNMLKISGKVFYTLGLEKKRLILILDFEFLKAFERFWQKGLICVIFYHASHFLFFIESSKFSNMNERFFAAFWHFREFWNVRSNPVTISGIWNITSVSTNNEIKIYPKHKTNKIICESLFLLISWRLSLHFVQSLNH